MPRRVTIEALARDLRGQRVYLPGAAGEPAGLTASLFGDPAMSAGLDLVTSAIAGINPLDVDRLAPDARVTGLFMQPGLAAAQRAGRYRHLPVSYSGFARHLLEGPAFDTCILHLAPPGPDGRCSLGAAVEFTPLAAGRSRRLVGVVNEAMPPIPGAHGIAFEDLDLVADDGAALRTYEVGPPSVEASAIAGHIARLLPDRATIQLGIGKAPDALLGLLSDRRGLRLHGGMLADSYMAFASSGALDPQRRTTVGACIGSPDLYAWLRGRDGIDVRSTDRTHGVAAVTGIERFVAVNSALSVDLFGQCNGEVARGAQVSGFGGAPDFARAARHSPGGISVVALPASYGGDQKSRIVPRLSDELVSVPRGDVDVVVTEHGAADLRGRSVHERAEALVAVAAPVRRRELAEAWRALAARL